jgi:hypothetical protein
MNVKVEKMDRELSSYMEATVAVGNLYKRMREACLQMGYQLDAARNEPDQYKEACMKAYKWGESGAPTADLMQILKDVLGAK